MEAAKKPARAYPIVKVRLPNHGDTNSGARGGSLLLAIFGAGTIRLANILDVKRSVSTASAFTIYHSLPDREPYSMRAGGPAGSRAWIRKLHTHAPLLSESRQEEWSIGIGGANHLESRTSPDHHPNAYAIIWWDDEFVGKSEIRICTRHPVWNCKLYYAPPVKATGTIHIAVFNSSDGRTVTEHDEMLGEATIVVDDKSSEPAESCHDITLSGDMTGTVTIGVQKLSGDESDDDEDDDMDDSDEASPLLCLHVNPVFAHALCIAPVTCVAHSRRNSLT